MLAALGLAMFWTLTVFALTDSNVNSLIQAASAITSALISVLGAYIVVKRKGGDRDEK